MFLWWCFCGGVFVLVCGGVLVVVYKSITPVLQSTTPVLLRTTPVLLRTTKYYSSTTPYYKVLLQYYKVLLRTTKYYSSTTKYYSAQQSNTPVLLQSTTPVLLRTTEHYSDLWNDVRTTSFQYYSVLRQYYKSFQNEHFVRGFRNFSQKKLPKWSFRARLPPNFTEQASKTSVSRDASDNFHRKSFQKDRFVRGFLQISQNKLPKRAFCAMLPPNFTEKTSKMIVSCEASSKFHRTVLPKRAFRAMLPTIFTKNLRFATVSRNRHTDSCERVHPPKAKCASHYNAVHSQISKCTFRYSGVRKNVWIYRPWTDPLRAHKNVTFYYSFGRSTPRFYREGSPRANEICVSLQFWAIDTTFLPRGLTARKWNLRFATVLGDRHHVFTARVARRQLKFTFRYSFGRSTPRF